MGRPKNIGGADFMTKLAAFIVDKRNLIFLIIGILIIFSAFSRNWVTVNDDLAAYIPKHSETRLGLDVMEEQFTTFGTADFMIANVTLSEAYRIQDEMAAVRGVQSVDFDGTSDHYNNVSALFSVTFDYDENDERCASAFYELRDMYASRDTYISTSVINSSAEIIEDEVSVIIVIVAIIVVAILILTSQTYAEVPVLLITFLTAAIINLGTNFLFGEISFVSNSVTSILQLALSMDYAIILCNRFKEERQTLSVRDAVVAALSKGIPEIGASSLTTVGGLVAMLFMQFRIGADMAICLIKSIFCALFSVFVLMPGLLVLFSPLMDKTRHRSFIPKISFVGKFAYATRRFVPIIFVVIVLAALFFSGKCPFVYGYETIETPKLNRDQIATQMINDNFTSSNTVALIVPAGDYEKERSLLNELEAMPQVKTAMGLSNIEAMDGYTLTDRLTPRRFSELADLDYETAQLIYAAYATDREEYGRLISGVTAYSVPLIDMLLFVCEQADGGFVSLSDEQTDFLDDARTQMTAAQLQLRGEDYSRMLIDLDIPIGGDENFAAIDAVHAAAQRAYPDGDVYVVGDSTLEYEFKKSFSLDNITVSIVSILIVLVVLLFTFKSAGMPILLIIVIQGSIWINFSVPFFTGVDIFFLSYMIVSSIQMGANIDYAIVTASRYMELRDKMSEREAIIETLNFAFPTIITSGLMLTLAGVLIGGMTSEGCIVGIGQSIGRGTLISIALVLLVLPQILLLGSRVIEKTSFSVPSAIKRKTASGRIYIDGVIHGEISGTVSGVMHGIVNGDVNVNLISGTVSEEAAQKDEK